MLEDEIVACSRHLQQKDVSITIINVVELNLINPSKLRLLYQYFMSPSNNPLNDHQKYALGMRKVTYYFFFDPQEFN